MYQGYMRILEGFLSGKKVFRGSLELYRDCVYGACILYKGYLRLDRDSRGVIWGLYRVQDGTRVVDGIHRDYWGMENMKIP